MAETGLHIDAIRADGLSGDQLYVDGTDIAYDFNHIAVLQALGCRGLDIHPKTGFIVILVQQLIILRAKLGLPGSFSSQEIELTGFRCRRLFPFGHAVKTGFVQGIGLQLDLSAGRGPFEDVGIASRQIHVTAGTNCVEGHTQRSQLLSRDNPAHPYTGRSH